MSQEEEEEENLPFMGGFVRGFCSDGVYKSWGAIL